MEFIRIEFIRIEFIRIGFIRIEFIRIEFIKIEFIRIEFTRIEFIRIEFIRIEFTVIRRVGLRVGLGLHGQATVLQVGLGLGTLSGIGSNGGIWVGVWGCGIGMEMG